MTHLQFTHARTHIEHTQCASGNKLEIFTQVHAEASTWTTQHVVWTSSFLLVYLAHRIPYATLDPWLHFTHFKLKSCANFKNSEPIRFAQDFIYLRFFISHNRKECEPLLYLTLANWRREQKTFVRVSHFKGDISGFSFSERKFRIGQPNNGREI